MNKLNNFGQLQKPKPQKVMKVKPIGNLNKKTKKKKKNLKRQLEQQSNPQMYVGNSAEDKLNSLVLRSQSRKILQYDSDMAYRKLFVTNDLKTSVQRPNSTLGATHVFYGEATSLIPVSSAGTFAGSCVYVCHPDLLGLFNLNSLASPAFYMNDPLWNPNLGTLSGGATQVNFFDSSLVSAAELSLPIESDLTLINHVQLEIQTTGFSRYNAAGFIHLAVIYDPQYEWGPQTTVPTTYSAYNINIMKKQSSYKKIDLANNANIEKFILNFAPLQGSECYDVQGSTNTDNHASGRATRVVPKLVVIAEKLPTTGSLSIITKVQGEFVPQPESVLVYPTRRTTNWHESRFIHSQFNSDINWLTQIVTS